MLTGSKVSMIAARLLLYNPEFRSRLFFFLLLLELYLLIF
jgi:hypothetical protein